MALPIPKLTDTQLSNYLAKVDRSAGIDNCWLWVGSKKVNKKHPTDIRGQFRIGDRMYLVSRIAYYLANDTCDTQQEVCHSCDNTVCVNPNHLWLGTHKQNMADMSSKGRAKNLFHALKTHCVRGHEYDEANTRHYKGSRYCIECARLDYIKRKQEGRIKR